MKKHYLLVHVLESVLDVWRKLGGEEVKIVLVTNHGNAWIVKCSATKHGGLSLSEGEVVVAALPYVVEEDEYIGRNQ